ncbi:unnamed protein product [Coffea canephora]|uniref:Glycosyltransferase n=1 Tax=Coffea canephora TaxID=49390 RepID=A0A068TRG0_COFCA|nr:unnamed protein product [Coffea canephora]
MSISPNQSPHVLLFPYPTAGHVIPLLDLANLLLTKGLTITILVTPPNLPLLDPLLSTHPSTSIQRLVLSLPELVNSSGVNFATRLRATAQLHDTVLEWFQSQQSPPVAIISDFFLGWTHHLAAQLGVPRVVFWPSGAHHALILHHLWHNLSEKISSMNEDSMISFPSLPNSPAYPLWQVAELITQSKPGEPDWEFFRDNFLSNARSWGIIINSFRDLEDTCINLVKTEICHDEVWAIGPLVLSSSASTAAATGDTSALSNRGGSSAVPLDEVMTWLDDKADDSVVYVCFGSREVLTSQQTDALAAALECSGVHFIWCAREAQQNKGQVSCDDQTSALLTMEYEDRVAGKGLIIRGWAPQVAILQHRAVGAFLTHCGWNSVLEGVAAGVVLLTWPIGADQFANAGLLVDELGLAIPACLGGPKVVPDSTKLAQVFVGSVSVDGQPKRAKVVEMRDAASRAVQNGGSSSKDLDDLVKHLRDLKQEKS